MKEAFNFSGVEKEIVVLAAVCSLVDDIVNNEVLEIYLSEPSTVRFGSSTHMSFFSVLLVDFLSKPDASVFGLTDSYLGCLRAVANKPLLSGRDDLGELSKATQALSDWLEHRLIYRAAWFPSINLEIDLSIRRFDVLDLCGNISKHNFTRLTRVARSISLVFEQNGKPLTQHEALAIIGELHEQLKSILLYHATTISAALNNIRWGIHEYLQPVYQEALVVSPEDPREYHFRLPTELKCEFARDCFWELMNKVRREPHVPRFSVPSYLQQRY